MSFSTTTLISVGVLLVASVFLHPSEVLAENSICFTTSSGSFEESAGSINVGVSILGIQQHTQTITVNYSVSGGTASGSGIDYTLASGTLTFGPNVTDRYITIPIVNDSTWESDETIVIGLNNASGATITTPFQYTCTIIDDDQPKPMVSFATDSQSTVNESGTVTITAQLSGTYDHIVTIPFTCVGTATSADYGVSSSPISIPVGSTTGSITITITPDALDELNETIAITMGEPVNAIKSSPFIHTVTITDDDGPTVSILAIPTSINEAAGVSVITGTLSADSVQDVTINLGYSGTATRNSDYTAADSITIVAGQLTGTTTITTVQDTIDEADETVVVDIASAVNASENGTQKQTITINDDDECPSVTIAVGKFNINEAAGTSVITAKLSVVSGQNITVNLGYSGTATRNSDYTGANSITIVAGQLTGTATITAISDVIDEIDETVVVDITSVVNAIENGVQQQTVTITDDDGPTVTLATSVSNITEDAAVSAITCTLSAVSPQVVTVNLGYSGTATRNSDYTSTADSITIAAGQLVGTAIITAVQDALDETNETIVVDITSVVNAAESGTQRQTVYIMDDDGPTVTLAASKASIAESSGSSVITATLSATTVQTVTINFGYNGTATRNSDYTVANLITIAAGQLTGTATITAIPDAIDEIDETVVVDITSVVNAIENGVQQQTVTIIDNDGPTVTLVTSASNIAEEVGVSAITCTLSAVSPQVVTVNLGYSGTATRNSDYTSTADSITIAAGQLAGTASITAVQDALDETDETIVVDITSVVNATENGTQKRLVSIMDDDGPTVKMTTGMSNISEAAGTTLITCTLSAVSPQEVMVNLNYSGTATRNSDYTSSADSITIAAGQLVGTAIITAVQDALDETDETIVVDITSVVNATINGVRQQTLFVVDDDESPFYMAVGMAIVPIGVTNVVQITSDNSGDGGTAIKLGSVGLLSDGGTAGFECSVTGTGVLAFDWKVSSEADYDWLRFFEVSGSVTNQISGTGVGWSRVFMTVTGATNDVHTFRWEYVKDPVGDYTGEDCGWVDAISWSPFFSAIVNGGAGDGQYTNGTSVTIAAEAPAAHFQFDRWIGETNGVANVFDSSTLLVMSTNSVEVTATYKPILYTLIVVNGSGGGLYPYASVAEIGATQFVGKRFYRWTGDVENISDVAAVTTTVLTAGQTLSLFATYSVPLTVNAGTGNGWYPEGAAVTVTADPDPMYMEFAGWAGDATGRLANASSRTTSLTMPTNSTTLSATYRDSVARVSGSFGRTYTTSGTSGGLSADIAAGSPSGTPAVKLGGAGVVPDSGFAAFETVVSGSGTVTFWWRVSSESNADYLKFMVDGVQIAAISGTKGSWAQVTNRVEGAGVTHTLRWEYAKNASVAGSTDAGWVDDIIWTGDVPEPVIRPDISAVAATDGLFGISFLGERGIPYTVYSNATLEASGWAPMVVLPLNMGETNGGFRFLATVVTDSGQKTCFYRLGVSPEVPSTPSDMVRVQDGALTNIGGVMRR